MNKMLNLLFVFVLLLSACTTTARSEAPAATQAPGLTASAPAAETSEPTTTLTASAASTSESTTTPPASAATSAATKPGVSSTPLPSPTAMPLPTSVVEVTPSPIISAPTQAATSAPPSTLLDQMLPRHQKVTETAHFIFYAQDGYFPVDQTWWTQQAEVLYDYVSQRVQVQAAQKIAVAFMPPEKRSCPVRGLTAQDKPPTVLIYADASSSRDYLLAVFSHELGHAIPAEGFPGLPDSIALTEGLASWASGKYWTEWKGVPTLDDLIRQYIQNGQYEPIRENYDLHGIYPWQNPNESSQDCLARRDKVYSEWADFLGYLIDTYGWDKARQLFHNPAPVRTHDRIIQFPPNYEGIYGKSLNQLEWEWLQKLGHRISQKAER